MAAKLRALGREEFSPASGKLTDRSGSIAAADTSQQLMAANPERAYWMLQNHSAADLWIREGAAATTGQPSTRIGPLETYTPAFIDTRRIFIISDTEGVEFTCKEG
jgi:hypothetical protein